MDPTLFNSPEVVDALQHFTHAIENTSGSILAKAGTNWVVARIERFYKKHCKDNDKETQLLEVQRLLSFYEVLDARLIALESRGATSENLKTAFVDPQASRIIEAACLAASETTDSNKRETLADLVAQRITAGNETSYALYLRRAVQEVRDLQPRHLTILGLMFLIQDVPLPNVPDLRESGFRRYEAWLSDALQRLDVTVVSVEDMVHLQSLGLVVPVDPAAIIDNSRRLPSHENSFVHGLMVRGLSERLIRQSEAVRRAAHLLDARTDALDRDFAKIALGDYRLTGSGDVLAVTVMRQRGVGSFNVDFGVYQKRGEVPTYHVKLEEQLTTTDGLEASVTVGDTS